MGVRMDKNSDSVEIEFGQDMEVIEYRLSPGQVRRLMMIMKRYWG